MRTGAFVGHKCISSLTRSEAKMAGDVFRHSAVPLAPASLRPAFDITAKLYLGSVHFLWQEYENWCICWSQVHQFTYKK